MTVTVEVLEELVKDAAAARVSAEAQLEETEQQMLALRAQIVALRQEEDALSAVLQRRFPEAPAAAAAGPSPESGLGTPAKLALWRKMPRTIAVRKAVTAICETAPWASPDAILGYLQDKGRTQDTKDKIGASTAFLNRRNEIHSVGRGKWVPGPDPNAAPDQIDDPEATA